MHTSCQKKSHVDESAETTPALQPRTGPPALEELQNMQFSGFEGLQPLTLQDGLWQGPPAVEGGAARPEVRLLGDLLLTGDLDADGDEETVAFLDLASGGTGQFLYLAVVERVEGLPRNVATTLVGDRVQIRDARIESGQIVLDVVQAGPEDAMCCPGELARRTWVFEEPGALRPVEGSVSTGRLTLETIAGIDWVLRFWEWNVRAPVEPEVTLRLEGDRIGGTNGCNNYFATVSAGEAPGDVTLGPLGATRMACPGAASAVESRFMQQLEGVKKFGFMLGRLALTYDVDGRLGVMLFEARGKDSDESHEGAAPSP
jgi:heat shock protein HslJ